MLYVGDRVAVLNDFIYRTGGSKLAQFPIHCSLTAQYLKLVVALFSRLNSSA
jgi:hypothetical protein